MRTLVYFSFGLSMALGSIYESRTNSSNTAFGIISGIIGIILLFFGIRFFKIALFLSGICVGWFIDETFVITQGFIGVDNTILIAIIPLIIGILVGFVFLLVFPVGIAAIGALGGFSLSIYIFSWKSAGVMDHSVARPILMTVIPCIGAVISLMYEREMIILGTALFGSLCFCSSMDTFSSTGFNRAISYLVHNRGNFDTDDGLIGLLIVYFIVSVLGIFVQFRIFRKYTHRGRIQSVYDE
jgi:hypothetical protein